jgi:hypothetical protein
MVFARTSLPVPVSPVIKTDTLVAATRRAVARSSFISSLGNRPPASSSTRVSGQSAARFLASSMRSRTAKAPAQIRATSLNARDLSGSSGISQTSAHVAVPSEPSGRTQLSSDLPSFDIGRPLTSCTWGEQSRILIAAVNSWPSRRGLCATIRAADSVLAVNSAAESP